MIFLILIKKYISSFKSHPVEFSSGLWKIENKSGLCIAEKLSRCVVNAVISPILYSRPKYTSLLNMCLTGTFLDSSLFCYPSVGILSWSIIFWKCDELNWTEFYGMAIEQNGNITFHERNTVLSTVLAYPKIALALSRSCSTFK